MGFGQNVAGRVREFFAREPDKQAVKLIKGPERQDRPHMGYGHLLDAYGYSELANILEIGQGLMERFIDYENMEDYPEIATCLSGESMIFTLEHGWISIRDLAQSNSEFHVLSYDSEIRSLIPARAAGAVQSFPAGHRKPMVRVVMDDGQSICCTDDHQFMTKAGEWVQAGDLKPEMRLMPGRCRLRTLNGNEEKTYWQVHQPHADSNIRTTDGKRWTWVHRLVAEMMLGAESGEDQTVHHLDCDRFNNSPVNLSLEDRSTHASYHIAGLDNTKYLPDWTPERRVEMSIRMAGNTFRVGKRDSLETRQRKSDSGRGRRKSAGWRRRIGLSQPNRINIPRGDLEAALEESGTIAGVARMLGVSWSKAKRAVAQHDLLSDGANHRVVRVERLKSREALYDISVPGYFNFVCNGTVVHNSYDIYADDATQPDFLKKQTIWATAKDQNIEKMLNDLLHKKLRIEDDIWPLARTLSKYGNVYGENLITNEGVIGVNFLPVPTVRRVQDKHGVLLGFVQDTSGSFQVGIEEFAALLMRSQAGLPASMVRGGHEMTAYEDWEVTHWRLASKHLRSLYGYGISEPARWIWKRLMLLEDALLIYKLTRAPSRYAFYVDTGGLDQQRALTYVDQVAQRLKRKKFINPTTGKPDLRYNPLAYDEDFFIPSRDGKDSTRIDVLSGPDFQCLTGATKIPLMDGTVATIKELSERKQFEVYSMDRDSKVVPGVAHSCRATKVDEVLEVELDNGEVVECSGNHPFLTRNGKWVRADQIEVGLSLMPLYRRVSNKVDGDPVNGYEILHHPGTKRWQATHRMVVEHEIGRRIKKDCVVHHKNGNKRDNRTENLGEKDRGDHARDHVLDSGYLHTPEVIARAREARQTPEARGKMKVAWEADSNRQQRHQERMVRMMADPDRRQLHGRIIGEWNRSQEHVEAVKGEGNPRWRSVTIDDLRALVADEGIRRFKDLYQFGWSQNLASRVLKEAGVRWPDFVEHIHADYERSGRGRSDERPMYLNHKVVAVRRTGRFEQLYDLIVNEYHNFALEAGVFVHNSVEDVEYFQNKLFAALKIPKTYLGRMEEAAKAVLCLTGDTKVPLLDGREMTMRELSERYDPGECFWTYSVDEDGRVVPGKSKNSRITKHDAEVWEVELDNGEMVRGTADHPFMMRDGSFRELAELNPGDSLMPLYRRISSTRNGQKLDGYEQVVDPVSNEWMYTHRVVGEFAQSERLPGEVFHHRNFNKRDNLPGNIELLESGLHIGIHSRHAEKTLGRSDVVKKRADSLHDWYASDELKDHCRANLKAIRNDSGSNFWKWLGSDEHRKLKSEQMTKQWEDPDGSMRSSRTSAWRSRMSEVMLSRLRDGTAPDTGGDRNGRWRDDACVDRLIEVAHSYRCRSRDDLVKWSGYSQSLIYRVLRDVGTTYAEFSEEHMAGGYKLCVEGNTGIQFGPQRNPHHARAMLNHKVVAVRRVGVEDCYDLTVEDHHNFAISAGVFVHNSQEDVQFARTIMRVQREISNGVRKTCRVHMAALNIAPSSVEYEVMMSTPSTIFDLARMEVWSARADLSDRLKETVPLDWILRRIFQFSEEEAVELMQKKDSEKKHDMEIEAEGSVAAEKISQAAEKPEEAMELMRTRSVARAKDIMTEGKDIEHYRKLDSKLTKLLSESGMTRQKLAETNLFLQEVRYGLRKRKSA